MTSRILVLALAAALVAAVVAQRPTRPPRPPSPPGPPGRPCRPDTDADKCKQAKDQCSNPQVQRYCGTTCCGVRPGPQETCGNETLVMCKQEVIASFDSCNTECRSSATNPQVCVNCVKTNLTNAGDGACCGCIPTVARTLFPGIHVPRGAQYCKEGPTHETCGAGLSSKCSSSIKEAASTCAAECSGDASKEQCVPCLTEFMQSANKWYCCGCLKSVIERYFKNVPVPTAAITCEKPKPTSSPGQAKCTTQDETACGSDIFNAVIRCTRQCDSTPDQCIGCIISAIPQAYEGKCCACVEQYAEKYFPDAKIPQGFQCHKA